MSDAQNPYEAAKDRGVKALIPADNELFIDIDTPEQLTQFYEMRALLHENAVSFKMKKTKSRTKGHFHIRATFRRNITPIERIALQAILGSDPKREALSWLRIQRGEEATFFFEDAA